jgi:urease accessory protein
MNERSTDSLLVLLQVANAAFPTGAFNHSYGFETLIEQGYIKDGPTLSHHCRDWVRFAVAPADGAAVALAHRAQQAGDIAALASLDETVGALKLARETREASIKTGRALLSALTDIFETEGLVTLTRAVQQGHCEGHQATIFGAGAALLGVAEREAVLAFLQSSLSNIASVGARLIPLGQVETQRIVARARTLLHEALEVALTRSLHRLGGAAIAFDIGAMEHERLETRLCMS